ncbi:hypothetical protein ACNR9Q_12290 [Maribacter sp. X9]|uniref:hypothetical protein n=1 Tax=Maribacter sp. X9 TaxID=3402159 RepID=UPI003AF378C3
MKTNNRIIRKFLFTVILTTGINCLGQTPEQVQLIEKAKKMQDSIVNTSFFKNLEAQAKKEEALYQTRTEEDPNIIEDTVQRTNFPVQVENFPFDTMDLVTYPLGMEKPIHIGQIQKGGVLRFELPKTLHVPEEQLGSITTDLATLFLANCYTYAEELDTGNEVNGFKVEQIGLETSEGRYAGVLFVVSSEDMIPWLEDPMYMEPVLGSYYQLVYISNPIDFTKDCKYPIDSGNGDVPVSYDYRLDLKEGYQFIRYTINSIYETDPNIRASFPDKVEVTSVKELPKALWVGKYF